MQHCQNTKPSSDQVKPGNWWGTLKLGKFNIPNLSNPEKRAFLKNKILKIHLLPLALYFLITLVMTYPLILHFNSQVIGDNGDAWQNIWNYWWTGQALSHFKSPFKTDLLYAPYGAPLYLQSLNLFNAFISLPVQILFGLVAAYNFVVLFSFTLAGYWTYLLVTFFCKNRLAGFAGGLIYAFSSYQLTQLYLGQANLFASEWLPAYIFGLVSANATAGRKRLFYSGLALFSLFFIMLCDWQYIIYAGLFTALYTLYLVITRRSFLPVLVSGTIGVIWLVFSLFLIIKTIDFINSKDAQLTFYSFLLGYSADLYSFIIPSPRNTFLGGIATNFNGDITDLGHNKAVYLGLLPVLLSGIGLWKGFKQNWFWLVTGLIFAVLSLGPLLHVGGQLLQDTKLPYSWLQDLPGISVARVPVRFILITVLCLAVLSGYGLAALLPLIKNYRWQTAAMGLVSVLLLAEHISIPFPSNPAPVMPWYQQLAKSGEQGAMLELPYIRSRSLSLYYQTIHQHPMVGGYLSRAIDYPILDIPPLHEMPAPDGKDMVINNTTEAEAGVRELNLAGIKWIVFLLKDPNLDKSGIPAFVAKFTESTPVYQDEDMLVYRSKQTTDLDKPLFLIDFSGGWHEPEKSDLGPTYKMRWFDRRGGMYAWNVSSKTQQVVMEFDVWNFHIPHQLILRVDGKDIAEWNIGDLKHLSIPFTLSPGRHEVEFRAPKEDPVSPFELGMGNDKRLLSLGVANLQIKAADGS